MSDGKAEMKAAAARFDDLFWDITVGFELADDPDFDMHELMVLEEFFATDPRTRIVRPAIPFDARRGSIRARKLG